MRTFKTAMAVLAVTAMAFAFAACDSDSGTETPGTDVPVGQPDTAGDTGGGECEPTTVWFKVDDSANKTYQDGQMEWKGSMKFDEATGTIELDTSWGGPYPKLYDDGPVSAGGHEAEGQVAGDSIFSVQVQVTTEEAITIEYGLVDESGNWIWQGTNGQVEIGACAGGVVEATGMAFAPFGTIDMKVMFNAAEVHADFATVDFVNSPVKVKGTMTSWQEVTLADGGAKGDATAGDGIFTFQLSENLGAHAGLTKEGDRVQFVFVFGESEYKAGSNALTEGVSAMSTASGDWADEAVILEGDSGGQNMNTVVVIGAAE